MSTVEQLQLLSKAALNNQVTAYFEIASITILVYDYILTFKLEVALVWGSPWNIGRVLFVLTRYMVFIDAHLLGYFHFAGGEFVSIQTCKLLYQVSGWMIFWGIAVAQLVLIFRTWAIWGQDRKIAIGLLILLLALGIPSAYLTQKELDGVKFSESPVPRIHSCFLLQVDTPIMLLDYIVIFMLETVILAFTLIKGVYHYRYTKSSLVLTLYKDGILFFIYLTFLSIANVLVLAFPEQTQGASLILMQRVFHSMLTARILLHLRLAGLRDRMDASKSDTPPALNSMFDESHQGQLSTVILGVDTWFYDRESTSEDPYGLV